MPEIPASNLENYKAEHLLLLAGGNTLPNAVAAPHLVQQNGAITILCTKGTEGIAKNHLLPYLNHNLAGAGVAISVFHELMDDSRQASICRTVTNALGKHPGKRVGLHYTTGTKAMAVHAHRVVSSENTADNKPLLSYLSARNLRLYFDMESPMGGGEEDYINMHAEKVSLEEMLNLHGGEFFRGYKPQTSVPMPEATTKLALVQIKDDSPEYTRWSSWSRPLANLLSARKSGLDYMDKRYKQKLEERLLPYAQISLDGLPNDLVTTLRNDFSLSDNMLDLNEQVGANRIDAVQTFYEWAGTGKWLEHYTLHALKQASDNAGLDMEDCCMNIEPTFKGGGPFRFELDVLGIRGYRLFGFSCAAERKLNEGEERAKWKLFEAIMRARQMGGDEARIGFVTLLSAHAATELVKEAERTLQEGSKIRVFSINDIPNLQTRIANWIEAIKAEA